MPHEYSAYIGIFLLQCGSGALNTWGALGPYITSYFHSKNPSVTSSTFLAMLIGAFIIDSFTIIIAGELSRKYKTFWIILSGVTLSCACLLTSSIMTSAYFFMLFYSIGAGVLSSLGAGISMWLAWERVPANRQGFISGIGLCGYTLAGSIFGLVMTSLVNKENIQPITVSKGLKEEAFFPEEVFSKVPNALITLTVIYFCLCMSGLAMLYSNSVIQHQSKPNFSLGRLLKMKAFWMMFIVLWITYFFYMYFTTVYKNLAFTSILDDHFITYVASVGMCVNALSRIFWGAILDKVEWSKVMKIILFGQILTSLVESYSVSYKETFASAFIFGSFFTAPSYLSIVILINQVFPDDKWVLIYISFSYNFSLLSMYLTECLILPNLGYHLTYLLISALLFLALLISSRKFQVNEDQKKILPSTSR